MEKRILVIAVGIALVLIILVNAIHNFTENGAEQFNGGNLDRDDTDGYGPENIFWEDAPDGSYRVEVNHYSGTTPARYIVTINGLGTSRQFTGTLSRSVQTDLITTVRKSGNSINF